MFTQAGICNIHSTQYYLSPRIPSPCQRFYAVDISRNRLAKISEKAFVNLKNLSYLDVSYNQLRLLSFDIMHHLQRLKTLNISGNFQMSLIESKLVFQNLTELRTLAIADTRNLPLGIFTPLHTRLLELNVSGIELNSESLHMLKPLTNLKLLDVSRNLLKGFEDDFIELLMTVDDVRFDQNPFVCDLCNMDKIFSRITMVRRRRRGMKKNSILEFYLLFVLFFSSFFRTKRHSELFTNASSFHFFPFSLSLSLVLALSVGEDEMAVCSGLLSARGVERNNNWPTRDVQSRNLSWPLYRRGKRCRKHTSHPERASIWLSRFHCNLDLHTRCAHFHNHNCFVPSAASQRLVVDRKYQTKQLKVLQDYYCGEDLKRIFRWRKDILMC